MARLLLLYDTLEKDLARDFKDLLEEINVGSIVMIPLSANRGLNLEEKEAEYFNSADGAIFIITPGSIRFEEVYPSPSVTHEMGQAKQKFYKKPECVIYMVDTDCKMPTLEQKAYIPFNRKDIRSVIAALTQLITNLKGAGLFRTNPIPTQQSASKINLVDILKGLSEKLKQLLLDISNKDNGFITEGDLKNILLTKYKLDTQGINFMKRDLLSSGVVLYNNGFWFLNDTGWGVVRLEADAKKKRDAESLNVLFDAIAKSKILGKM